MQIDNTDNIKRIKELKNDLEFYTKKSTYPKYKKESEEKIKEIVKEIGGEKMKKETNGNLAWVGRNDASIMFPEGVDVDVPSLKVKMQEAKTVIDSLFAGAQLQTAHNQNSCGHENQKPISGVGGKGPWSALVCEDCNSIKFEGKDWKPKRSK